MPSVLVVDDDVLILAALIRICRRFPVELRSATSAPEALALIEQRPPTLLITDLRMPVMNGLELIYAVQQKFPAVRCVLHTADSGIDCEPGIEILIKPCEIDVLDRLISSIVVAT
ncbi:MAG: response regulator [Deltaproteobacteria bacterium]|nr:response regulator [Deltaproteobacteria bacterium]